MKPLPLLLGLLALASAGTSAALWFTVVRERTAQAQALHAAQAQTQAAEAHLATLTAQAKVLRAQVAELDASLGETKTQLTVTEARNVQLTRDLNAAKQAPPPPPPAHDDAQDQEIARLTQELAAARTAATSAEAAAADLTQQLAAARTPAPAAPAPDAVLTTSRARTATVASVGPSSAFVVLNYGAAHGALPAQQFLIQRGTDVLARVLISDVRDQYSIAQVSPDSLRGALHKGDLAVLTQ